jgi:hypothetical protein
MTDFDLDRLGDVWRQQPDPEELERLRKSAAAVARRARRAQVVDIGAALLVSAVVIFLVASNPKMETVLMGAAAILILLAGNVRLRRVRRIELSNLTGGTEEMLDQSITRVETTVRHHRYGAIIIGPGVILGALIASVSQGRQLFPGFQAGSPLRVLWVALTLALVVGGVVYSLRAMKRARRELTRLKTMREAYRQERESTGS